MSRRKSTQVIVPLFVGAMVATGAAVALSGGSATATPREYEISLTANGPQPGAVELKPGDTVVYSNDVDPTDGGGLLSSTLGAVQSVSVKVYDATVEPFTLPQGESKKVTYSEAVRTTYTAHYTATLLNLLPRNMGDQTGEVVVRDDSNDKPPVEEPSIDPQAAQAGGTEDSSDPVQSTTDGDEQTGTGAGTGDDADDSGRDQAGTDQGDNPPGDAGSGQPDAPDNETTAATGDGSAGGGSDDTNADEPSASHLPEADHYEVVERSSSDSSQVAMGLSVPAILAVVLLSMVSAGLVRTMMVRYAHAHH